MTVREAREKLLSIPASELSDDGRKMLEIWTHWLDLQPDNCQVSKLSNSDIRLEHFIDTCRTK